MTTFPDYPLPANKTNLTPQSDDHPEHHNALARAVNHLQGQLDAPVTSARIVDGTLATVDFQNLSVTAKKLVPSAKSPLSTRVTGSYYADIGATERTVCTVNLTGQPFAGDWLVNGFIAISVISPTSGAMCAMKIRESPSLTILSDSNFEAKLDKVTMNTSIWVQVPALTPKTLIMTLQRWGGSTALLSTTGQLPFMRLEAKFFPTP